jgi:hypothetical protein
MKGYILRDKEAEEEAKKAIKAKNQGQWIRGAGNVRRMGDLSGSGQSLFQGWPLKEEVAQPFRSAEPRSGAESSTMRALNAEFLIS